MPQHYIRGHGLMISAAKRPVVFGWKENERWREGPLNPGEFRLVTDGGFSSPRWPETFDAVTVSLDGRNLIVIHVQCLRVGTVRSINM